MKRKRNIVFVLLLMISVGVTIAYLQSTDTFENIFKAGTYSVVTHEEFVSPDNWKPGDTIPKTITTKNEGTVPVMVRVRFNEKWLSSNNEELPLIDNNEPVAIINFDNEVDWFRFYDDGLYDANYDGSIYDKISYYYFYYIDELAPGETTSSLIDSVTFNPNYNGKVTCIYNSLTNSNECSSSDEYMGGTYTLGITVETVQADKYREVWGDFAPILYNYVGANPCTFEGELVPGVEYINGQYTYKYGEDYIGNVLFGNGWSVYLTDKESTSSVTSQLCSSINDNPILSMADMFSGSQAQSIDLSSFDTSNVFDMSSMFSNSNATSLDFSSFNTGNVISMENMFSDSQVTTLDLRNFDTSKVTDMGGMFSNSNATTLDLSSFDTSNVFLMSSMFSNSNATTIDLSSFDTSNVTDMTDMFSDLNTNVLNISNFNFDRVEVSLGVINCINGSFISVITDTDNKAAYIYNNIELGRNNILIYVGNDLKYSNGSDGPV